MGDVMRALMEILRLLASHDAEVAAFLHGLLVGAPAARERIVDVLPPAWAARAVAEIVARDTAESPPELPPIGRK